jgi:prophage regulatory protein
MKRINQERTLLKLKEVLEIYPISKTSWYEGIRIGLYPPPIRLGKKTVAWRSTDIEAAINELNNK